MPTPSSVKVAGDRLEPELEHRRRRPEEAILKRG
jgi:hypothetical protein